MRVAMGRAVYADGRSVSDNGGAILSKNHILLEGRVGRDGGMRGKVGKFPLAVQSWRKDPNAPPGSKYPNLTNWFQVIGFAEKAAVAASMAKGQIVQVEGSLEIDEWKDSAGNSRVTVQVHVSQHGRIEQINPGERKNDAQTAGHGARSGGIPANGWRGPLPQPEEKAGAEFFDDDVPF